MLSVLVGPVVCGASRAEWRGLLAGPTACPHLAWRRDWSQNSLDLVYPTWTGWAAGALSVWSGFTSLLDWRQHEGGDCASARWINGWINIVFCCTWGRRAEASSLGRLGFLPRAHHPGKRMLLAKEGRYLPGYGETSFLPSAGGLGVHHGGAHSPSVCLSSITLSKSLKAQPVGLTIRFVGLGREAYIIPV